MTDITQIIADIEACLDKATPGPWTHKEVMSRDGEMLLRNAVVSGHVEVVNDAERYRDAAYIAACSPDRIRALLDEVKRLQWDLDVETQAGHPVRVRLEAAEAELARLREPAGDVGEVVRRLDEHYWADKIENLVCLEARDLLLRQAGEIEEAKRVDALNIETIMKMNREIVAAGDLLREAVEVMRTAQDTGSFASIVAFLAKLSPAPEPREDTYPDRVSMEPWPYSGHAPGGSDADQ